MTRPDLDALAALLDKATPGPWRDCAASVTPMHGLFTETKQENSALIVAAVNALPGLLAYVRELERERDAAALAMREKCAQACEEIAQYDYQFKDTLHIARGNRADDCAAAIRELEA